LKFVHTWDSSALLQTRGRLFRCNRRPSLLTNAPVGFSRYVYPPLPQSFSLYCQLSPYSPFSFSRTSFLYSFPLVFSCRRVSCWVVAKLAGRINPTQSLIAVILETPPLQMIFAHHTLNYGNPMPIGGLQSRVILDAARDGSGISLMQVRSTVMVAASIAVI
jgi:hypothetical protein